MSRTHMLRQLREREVTGRTRHPVFHLRVFDYDEDGGITSKPQYALCNQRMVFAGSLFDLLDSVLPFEEWGTLYFLEGDFRGREIVFEEFYHDDPTIREHMRFELDHDYTWRIRRAPDRTCLQLHRRFP